jgi:pyruvate dehydrogenase E2 component (dihydrolipoamide acetyltransferase)
VPNLQQFRLPDVGEGLTEAEILQWYVQVGDSVTVNQVLVEVETAKAAVELPSPYAGVVTELHAEPGETVDVGRPIITIDTEPGAAPPGPPPPEPVAQPVPVTSEPATPSPAAQSVQQADAARAQNLATAEFVPAPKPEREAVLVGYGVMSGSVSRRPRRRPAVDRPADQAAPASPAADRSRPRAKPPVRRLAKDLGVDLAQVPASGADGVVTRDDVEAYAGRSTAAPVVVQQVPVTPSAAAAVAATNGALEHREPVKGVRRVMADAMVRSAFTIPHVTEWVEVDATRTVKLVRRLRETPGFTDARVGPLLLVARAVLMALKTVPECNASWDDEADEVVFKDYVNLGIAAATPRGLVVPNLKAADRMSLPDLAHALADLVDTAKAGRTQPADMVGGTFTITNVGVFGIDAGTPIINPGESAILAVGALRERPWVHKGKVRPRWVVQLALSFDHRFIDGATGARFLAAVAGVLHDPAVPPTRL